MKAFFDEKRQVELIHEIIGRKIDNQKALLKYYAKIRRDHELFFIADEVGQISRRLQKEKDMDMMRGMEGIASKKYFSAFPLLLKEGWEWNGRSRRPPVDLVNAMLSYGYAFLEREVRIAIAGAGMDGRFGFFHTNNGRKDSLVFDLMELFHQPVIDKFVIKSINLGKFCHDGFYYESEAGCRIGKDLKLVWINSYKKAYGNILQ